MNPSFSYRQSGKYPVVSVLLLVIISCLGTLPAQAAVSEPVVAGDAGKVWQNPVDTVPSLTLQQCIDYALVHQPAIRRSTLYVAIARTTNQINLSAWLPQVGVSANVTHYIKLPTTLVAGTSGTSGGAVSRQTGVSNLATPELSASQAIFSPDLLYAVKTAKSYIRQAEQVTDSTKINVVSNVSKSFYNLLLNLEQINVLKEDTARLGKNLADTYHQFQSGIVDETDYDEADITLSNSRTQLRQATENIVPDYAQLKLYMGYAPEKQFNVSFDTLRMISQISLDTLQQLHTDKRIEYQQLGTEEELQRQLVNRYRYGFLPTLSAFYNYNYAFQNNSLSNLFQNAYPNSFVGISLSIPVFTGFNRVRNLHRARLQEQVLKVTETDLRSEIFTQYTTALANYKSNLYTMNVLKKNVEKARRVYFIVNLQYKQGIIPYLNVITAESTLITSEIGYINALFNLLSSKIDVQKAMGTIIY